MNTQSFIYPHFEISEDVRVFLDDLMTDAPAYLYNSLFYKEIPAGQMFVTIDMPLTCVYLILSGQAIIVDFMASGIEYAFDEIGVTEWVGELEAISNIPTSNATVMASTDCQTLCIPQDIFLKWMNEDVHALMIVSNAIIRRLLNQSTRHRRLFFIPARDRLLQLLRKMAETKKNKMIVIKINRMELANLLGCSERTVVRCLGELREQSLLSTKRGRIEITLEQYKKLCQECASLEI